MSVRLPQKCRQYYYELLVFISSPSKATPPIPNPEMINVNDPLPRNFEPFPVHSNSIEYEQIFYNLEEEELDKGLYEEVKNHQGDNL